MIINNRLLVEYICGYSPWDCCTKTYSRVSILNKELTDEQVIELIELAGLGCGQTVRIINKTKTLADNDKFNYFYIYNVETLCDSSD